LLGSQFGRVTRRRVRPQRIRPFCFRDSQPPADRTFVNSEGGRDFDFQPPHAIQFNGSESPPFSNLSPNLLLVAHPLILKVALFMQLSVVQLNQRLLMPASFHQAKRRGN
jgi:hypothetical protein